MTKFTSLFRQHSRPSDDSGNTLSVCSSSPTLVNQGSSDTSIEGDRLYEIFTPASDGRIDLDIVAVHGLMGNPYTTWTKGRDPNGKPWIMDFLPAQLPHARVFSYGYDSNFIRSSSVAGIPEFAMNLLAWLKLRRSTETERQRPLLFICHSLGGIIVKKVCCPNLYARWTLPTNLIARLWLLLTTGERTNSSAPSKGSPSWVSLTMVPASLNWANT